eukprot:4507426-Pyramimonas_sp.AAC.1
MCIRDSEEGNGTCASRSGASAGSSATPSRPPDSPAPCAAGAPDPRAARAGGRAEGAICSSTGAAPCSSGSAGASSAGGLVRSWEPSAVDLEWPNLGFEVAALGEPDVGLMAGAARSVSPPRCPPAAAA